MGHTGHSKGVQMVLLHTKSLATELQRQPFLELERAFGRL